MKPDMKPDTHKNQDPSAQSMRRSAERMKHARTNPSASPLRGFGVFGVIGWSIAIPTVGGAFLGMWLNKVAPQTFSWPIALILGGAMMGVIIAWRWISDESSNKEDLNKEVPK